MVDVGREIMWNVGHAGQYISYAFLVIVAIVLIMGLKKRYAMWKIGKPAPIQFTKRLGERIGYFIANGIFHKSILREAFPGWMHFFIFWGFLVLSVGTALVAIQADFTDLLFKVKFLKGGFYLIFSFFLDLAGLMAIIGILMAMYRRYVTKPSRLDNKPDDAIVLVWILVVLVTGFLAEGVRIAHSMPDYEKWSFVGYVTAYIFAGMPKESIEVTHTVFWYFHMVISFGLIAYIVHSRLLHIITSSLNMMFRGVEDVPEGARGAIAPIEDFENAEEFGVNSIEGFTWRQIFDLDACTRCGRCQDLCPAYNTDKPLLSEAVHTGPQGRVGAPLCGREERGRHDRYHDSGRDPVVLHRLYGLSGELSGVHPDLRQEYRDEALPHPYAEQDDVGDETSFQEPPEEQQPLWNGQEREAGLDRGPRYQERHGAGGGIPLLGGLCCIP
jgi:nitrate reductase gamma subunit/ferredoxin